MTSESLPDNERNPLLMRCNTRLLFAKRLPTWGACSPLWFFNFHTNLPFPPNLVRVVIMVPMYLQTMTANLPFNQTNLEQKDPFHLCIGLPRSFSFVQTAHFTPCWVSL